MSASATRRVRSVSLHSPDLMGTLGGLADFGKEAGERMRDARDRLGLTQFEAAVALGLKTEKTIGRWEAAKSKPGPKQWEKIEAVYGVTRKEIVGEPEPAQLDRLEAELAHQRVMLEALLDSMRPDWRELLHIEEIPLPPGAGPPRSDSEDRGQGRPSEDD